MSLERDKSINLNISKKKLRLLISNKENTVYLITDSMYDELYLKLNYWIIVHLHGIKEILNIFLLFIKKKILNILKIPCGI